ncbi:uncharacterized protein LOC123555086 [Mercenaria mercenaria]|uniref:uncharacterized protein LOC123555086 n=1 Tax=Mercenaria mercenaria TaxID=6596 RepID=UPI00234F5F5D|nr:uncharacterized protein LOC123555086 [Mercenaria mercenaria]
MDLNEINEIEMGTKSDDTYEVKKNENLGIVNRCPFRSVSMDGSAGDYLYKTPYSYARQNSINDSKEYNELKDQKDKDIVNSKSQIGIHNSTLNKARNDISQDSRNIKSFYSRQISATSATEKLLEKGTSLDSEKKMTETVLIESEHQLGRSEITEDPTWNEKKHWRNGGVCLYSMSGCSCLLSVLTIGLVVFVLLKVSTEKQEIATSMGFSHPGQTATEVNTAGSFKINQTYLREHKRIVWLKDETSEIIPSSVDDCLKVPYGGKYLVVSRFTFNILPEDNITTIIHFFKLKTSAGVQKDGGYKRKYVSVLENKLRTSNEVKANKELRKPSVFIEFFDLDANDQICPNVSSPKLLYESRMDNDVNIIKV